MLEKNGENCEKKGWEIRRDDRLKSKGEKDSREKWGNRKRKAFQQKKFWGYF